MGTRLAASRHAQRTIRNQGDFDEPDAPHSDTRLSALGTALDAMLRTPRPPDRPPSENVVSGNVLAMLSPSLGAGSARPVLGARG